MTSLWGVTVLLMVVIVAAGIQLKQRARDSATANDVAIVQPYEVASTQPQVYFDAPAFSLIDQRGQAFGNTDLKGKIWVSQFIFTTCQTSCPMMMLKMSQLQKTLDARVQLVSFTVDPSHDRPPVLLAKAAMLGADNTRWHFLTNPEGNTTAIGNVVSGMFEARPGPTDPNTMHSERFFLFDGAGKCRGIYSSTQPEAMAQLALDVTSLLSEKP